MTLDAYGRYVGRHRDWRDDPPGYAIDLDDGRHNLVARALFDDGTSEDRYDRPIEPVPVPRRGLDLMARFIKPAECDGPLATVNR